MSITRLPARHEDLEAALKVAALYERLWPGWSVVLIGAASAFHAALAVVLLAFPYEQLLTEGTRPVFDFLPPYVWAALFAAAAIGIALGLYWHRPLLHAAVWMGVIILFGMWLSPMITAVLGGGGSPVAVAVLLFLYGLFFGGAITNAIKQR